MNEQALNTPGTHDELQIQIRKHFSTLRAEEFLKKIFDRTVTMLAFPKLVLCGTILDKENWNLRNRTLNTKFFGDYFFLTFKGIGKRFIVQSNCGTKQGKKVSQFVRSRLFNRKLFSYFFFEGWNERFFLFLISSPAPRINFFQVSRCF